MRLSPLSQVRSAITYKNRFPVTIRQIHLELLGALDRDPRIAGHYRLDAVRAHFFEKMGDHEAAIQHYRIAAARTTSMPAERNYLLTQAARLPTINSRMVGNPYLGITSRLPVIREHHLHIAHELNSAEARVTGLELR